MICHFKKELRLHKLLTLSGELVPTEGTQKVGRGTLALGLQPRVLVPHFRPMAEKEGW